MKRAGFEGNQQRFNLTKVWLKVDSWSTGHTRWLEISEPSRVNPRYNGLHTRLASVCVTVYAGVWVGGRIAWVFMFSILTAGEGTISTLAPVKMTLITSGYIPAIHQVHLSVCFIQVFSTLLHLPFVHCKEKKMFLQMKADSFPLTPPLQVFIFSAVWPQQF